MSCNLYSNSSIIINTKGINEKRTTNRTVGKQYPSVWYWQSNMFTPSSFSCLFWAIILSMRYSIRFVVQPTRPEPKPYILQPWNYRMGKCNKHAKPYWSPTHTHARHPRRTWISEDRPEVTTTPHIYYIKKLRLNSDVNNANTLSQIKSVWRSYQSSRRRLSAVLEASTQKTQIENLACVPLLQSMT